MAKSDRQASALDNVDQQILAALREDARMSMSLLADKVHISRAHAYNRVTRLRDEGVITKFSALVDPARIGLKSSAYVTLKVKQHSWRELRANLAKIREIHHIALVGGDFDVILLVRAEDNEHLRNLVFDTLQAMPEIMDTQTFLIFDDVDAR